MFVAGMDASCSWSVMMEEKASECGAYIQAAPLVSTAVTAAMRAPTTPVRHCTSKGSGVGPRWGAFCRAVEQARRHARPRLVDRSCDCCFLHTKSLESPLRVTPTSWQSCPPPPSTSCRHVTLRLSLPAPRQSKACLPIVAPIAQPRALSPSSSACESPHTSAPAMTS